MDDDSTVTPGSRADASESGRILTSEEAAFLRRCLGEGVPVVVVGTEGAPKKPPSSDARETPKKAAKR